MHLVIPSYEKHIHWNEKFLKSFNKFCADKSDVEITFVCNQSNVDLFKGLTRKFKKLNVRIQTLTHLIQSVDQVYFDDSPFNFPTKYPLQSLKKLFAFSSTNADYLVIDSENVCLKDFYFHEIFERIKNQKIKADSRLVGELQNEVAKNCNELIDFNPKQWLFLDSYWFFEKDFVELLLNELRQINKTPSVHSLLKNRTFFEYQLYASFLIKKSLKQTIDVNEILRESNELRSNLEKSPNNYEYIGATVTKETWSDYISLLNRLNARITRLHWMHPDFAKAIVKNTNVCIGTYHEPRKNLITKARTLSESIYRTRL